MRIIEVDPSFAELVEQNGGYCPCAVQKVPETKCICKDFVEQDEPGLCHCGRYKKVADNDG